MHHFYQLLFGSLASLATAVLLVAWTVTSSFAEPQASQPFSGAKRSSLGRYGSGNLLRGPTGPLSK